MIILDTNVVSELMRPAPNPEVLESLRAQPAEAIATTVITVAEILYGLRLLPAGRRRAELELRFQELMDRSFRDRLLLFDEPAADAYSGLMVSRRRMGRPMQVLDAMIAGIALSQGAGVATRNAEHFEECGIRVLDPWASAGRK